LHGNVDEPSGTFVDVLYAPDIGKNLFSIGRMMARGDKGVDIRPNGASVISLKNNRMLMHASKRGNLYVIDGTPSGASAYIATTTSEEVWHVWHERLGHIGKKSLERMVKKKSVHGLPDYTPPDFNFCDGCAANKAFRQPFQERTKRAAGILDLI